MTTMWARMFSLNWVRIKLPSHWEFSFMSCITLPSRHQTIVQGPKEPDREVMMIEVDWRVAFIDYIQEHKLPPGVDPKNAEATHILRHSKGYVLVGGNLYKCGSLSGILMKYVCMEEGREIF
jgi:hypothetical protein